MSDIAKGILGGGWSLLVGWILPSAINVLVFGFFVLPNLKGVRLASEVMHASSGRQSLVALGASVVIGLIFSAFQVPLYRVLEGYLAWPYSLAKLSRRHQARKKQILSDRLDFIRLANLQAMGRLSEGGDENRLKELSADWNLRRFVVKDRERTAVQRALLRERLRRYPVDNEQIAPTRLGNAVRRLEEYGYQRYRLDSQALWYELAAVAPAQLRQQIDAARAGVDFFVGLLYGNLIVAFLAVASLATRNPNLFTLAITAGVMIVITPLWYSLAVVATDDWTLATRALVDVGRTFLAASVGLAIPKDLTKEREMWSEYCRFVRRPYQDGRDSALDAFRVSLEASGASE